MNKVFLTGVSLLLILIIFFLRSDFFTIKKIDVKKEQISCASDNDLKDSSRLLGQNFFLLNTQKTVKILKEKFICINNVILSRSFPDKIKIDVIGRIAVAILIPLNSSEATLSSIEEFIATPSADESQKFLHLDNEGVIFPQGEENPSIKIYYFGQNLIFKDALVILEKLKTFGLDVKEIKILENFLLINPGSGLKIIFQMGDKINIQLASLQLILEQAKIDGKSLEFIDLRFDKPIVKFAPGKK